MIEVTGAFDIETESWDRFVLGGMMLADGTYESFRDEDRMVDRLLAIGGTWWTWNGGLFDSLWLAEILRRRKLRCVVATAGPRAHRIECEGLVVRDAFALCPMKLERAALLAGLTLDKQTGLVCRCKDGCGGQCAIRRDMSEAEYAAVDTYLRRDCAAPIAILETLKAESERCGYRLGATIGGTSYATAANLSGIDKADWPDARTYYQARAGYYGGRVEVVRPRAAAGWIYDITSAYPAALSRLDLPTGPLRRLPPSKARVAFERGLEGIWRARVTVPRDRLLGPLPARTVGGRVHFPIGCFEGSWTGLELRGAIERGAAVTIGSGIVWADSEPALAPGLLSIWECRARARAEGNPTLYEWHKWIANSCTGKLAEDPDKERILINPGEDEVEICSCDGPHRAGRCRAWRPLDKEGRTWAAPFWRLSACAHVHWAAYLTAWTRQTWLAQAEADGGPRTVVYGDTDSLFVTAPRIRDIGDALGQWKEEGEFRDFCALAPKVYRYWSVAKSAWVVRGKGLPGLTVEGFERFARGEPVVVERGVLSFRQAARAGSLFQRRRLARRHHGDGARFGGRVLASDGMTRPQTHREVSSWE